MTINKTSELHKKIKELQKEILVCQKENEKLRLTADYDNLTGLYNRHGFIREAQKFLDEVYAAKKERRKFSIPSFSLLFVDLDGLKALNDKFGHEAGDKFISACAEIFKDHLREIDVVGRWGGDEFVIGLIGAGKQDAQKVAEKLKAEINKIKIKGIKHDELGASFGLIAMDSQSTDKPVSLSDLIEKSDAAMYVAKKKLGKNIIYAPEGILV